MCKKEKKFLVDSLLKYFFVFMGVFMFMACDKSATEPENGGSVSPDPDAVLLALTIKSMPLKTGYFIGDDFSTTGLVVEGKYDNGAFIPIPLDKLVYTGFTSENPNPKMFVKISYNDLSVDLEVQVYPFKVKDGVELTEYVENATSVVIPKGVVRIAVDAFVGKTMEAIVFPETLQEIGDYAFFSCRNLQNVKLPSSLQKVGEGVFDNCSSLSYADLSNTALTKVSEYMFSRCPHLSEVKLPSTILSIGNLAFNEATSLKNIVLPENARFIGLDAFRESGLERISLPNNMKTIRQRAFWGCASLAEVTTYGTYVPSNDEYSSLLESTAFENLPALTKFEIPLGIAVLEQTLLSNCPLLEKIEIPGTVTKIGFRAFANTTLKRVVMASATPPTAVPATGTSAWDAFPSTTSIEVPLASQDAYKQAFGWNEYANVIKGF